MTPYKIGSIVRRKMRRKRGTTLVEATIVFPLVIAAVMAVIYIMINMYMIAAGQAELHVGLRREAAQLSGTAEITMKNAYERDKYRTTMENLPFIYQEEASFKCDYVKGAFQREYKGNALMKKKQRKTNSKVYKICEVKRFW